MEIPKTIVDNWDSLTYGSMGIMGLDRLPTLALGGLKVDFGMNVTAQYYLLLGIMLLAAAVKPGGHPLQVGVDIAGPARKRNRGDHARHCGQPGKGQGPDAELLFGGHRRALYVHIMGLVEPALVFNLHLSVMPLIFSVFGGRTWILGPVLGAFILYPLEQLFLMPVLPMGHSALYGLVIILTIFFFPKGITAWLPSAPKSV